MIDYLELYKKFEDVKDIKDYIEDVKKLRQYYASGQYELMWDHINALTHKYFFETIVWNSVNRNMPVTYQEAYINAENFMQVQGAKLVVAKVIDYKKQLSHNEIAFVESIINNIE